MKGTTANRLNQIMAERGLKQVEILNLCRPYCERFGVKLNKNDLSQYVSGKVIPRQDKLSILALALNVNEVWLMGYEVPAGRDELENTIFKSPTPESIKIIQGEYGFEAVEALSLFVQLDETDKACVIERMKTLLENAKYSKQDGLKQA